MKEKQELMFIGISPRISRVGEIHPQLGSLPIGNNRAFFFSYKSQMSLPVLLIKVVTPVYWVIKFKTELSQTLYGSASCDQPTILLRTHQIF